MKKILLLIFTFFFLSETFSQNLNISNQFSIGGNGNDYLGFAEIFGSSNKFYFGGSDSDISGNKTENSRGGSDIWVVKTDANNNVLWDKTIGGDGQDFAKDCFIEGDKIFITAVTLSGLSGDKTTAGFGGYDIWLICLDTTGNILWQNEYGGDNVDVVNGILSHSDSSLLIIASSASGISGNKNLPSYGYNDFWLLEISKTNGAIIQQKVFGSIGLDDNPQITYCPFNNTYYLAGNSSTGASGTKTDEGYGFSDLWVVQLDENLNVLQDKCFGGSSVELSAGKILVNEDALYFSISSRSPISGNKSEGTFTINPGMSNDLWQIKTDLDLNIIWDRVYGGTGDESGSILFKNSNGNLVVSCQSKSSETGNKTAPRYGLSYDIWLLILDDNGNVLAQETYGGTEDEGGYILPKPNSNTELFLMADSYSGISGNKTVSSWGGRDAWFATIDASDFLSATSLNAQNESVAVYPNPFNSEANFKFRNVSEELTISFYAIDGRLLDEATINPANNPIYTWQNSGNESIILYSINGTTVHYQGKLVR